MKKLTLVLGIILLFASFCTSSWAAGSCTQTMAGTESSINKKVGLYTLTVSCTADASDGSFPDTALNSAYMATIGTMYLYKVIIVPGSTTPTASSDLTLADANSIDVLGGLGTDKVTTTAQAILAQPSTGYPVVTSESVWTQNIDNSEVHSAQVTIKYIFVQ